MTRKKLYTLTKPSFRIFSHFDKGNCIVTVGCGDVPMIRWPNGRWCLEGNAYIYSLFERGLSRKDKGGTLVTYAAEISQLIRFCSDNNVDLLELSDSLFSLFIRSLSMHTTQFTLSLRKRSPNTIIRVGRRCLDFLNWTANCRGDVDFIGPNGRIRATKQLIRGKSQDASSLRNGGKTYWSHRSFPVAVAAKKRVPISDENIKSLRQAVLDSSPTVFIRKRRYVLLTLLEITGARRYEIAQLRVRDVLNAYQMKEPRLRLITAKRGGNREVARELPISRIDLELLIEYVEKNRAAIIRRTCGAARDEGFVLISQTTGKGLRPNTITQELAALSKFVGIHGPASAHMFRHTFITKLFLALLEQHELNNPDDFRRTLLDVETLKMEVQQWTGHKDIKSLDPYIHLAFQLKTNLRNTLDKVRSIETINTLAKRLEEISESSRSGTAVNLDQLQRILKAGIDDLRNNS